TAGAYFYRGAPAGNVLNQAANPGDNGAGSLRVLGNIGQRLQQLLEDEASAAEHALDGLGVADNGAERLVDLMGYRGRVSAHHADSGDARELLAQFPGLFLGIEQLAKPRLSIEQRLLHALLISDVNARADIAVERAVRFEAGHAGVENPPIFSVEAAQTVFHAEFLAGVEGPNIRVQTALEIVGANALDPALARLLL